MSDRSVEEIITPENVDAVVTLGSALIACLSKKKKKSTGNNATTTETKKKKSSTKRK